jgi:hypothetical protein
MASTISAGTTSGTAIAIAGDTTGNLAFTTQAGANTITVPNSTGTITLNNSAQLCKAWVNFDGTTATIRDSFNVSSVVRTSTGKYTINFTTAMSNANYTVVSLGRDFNTSFTGGMGLEGTTPTTTACYVGFVNGTPAFTDATYMMFAIFGN